MSIKILAHRGASKYKEENTVESLEFAADMGADAVECDVTKLKDGTYVIFHDESLKRLTGKDIAIKDIGYEEMNKMLSACGRHLITFEELLEKYDRKVPILLHIKMTELEDDFVSMVRSANIPIVFGAVSTDVVKTLRTMYKSLAIVCASCFGLSFPIIISFLKNFGKSDTCKHTLEKHPSEWEPCIIPRGIINKVPRSKGISPFLVFIVPLPAR